MITQIGYKTVAHINKETKEINIASADTKLNIYDILDNVFIILHYPPVKLASLQNFVDDINEKQGDSEKDLEYIFDTCGHSLDAIVANLTTIEVLSRNLNFNESSTFDSPGSKPIVKEAIKKNLFICKLVTIIEGLTNFSKVLNSTLNNLNITNQHLGKAKLVLYSKKLETLKSENWGTYSLTQ